MPVLPNNFHGSTTFNNKITSYDALAARVKNMLGAPLVQIEITDEQLYQIIDTACEYYTKFSGVTEEFLIFRSDLYIPKVGLPVGRLLNITPDMMSSANPDLVEYPISYQQAPPVSPGVNGYISYIGNGVDNIFTVNHNLNTQDVVVQIYDRSNNELVYAGVFAPTPNSVVLRFNYAIPYESFKVVVLAGTRSGNPSDWIIGNGTDTSYTITHNLNNQNLIVQVYDVSTNQVVFPSIVNSTNTSTIIFEDPISANSHKVVIALADDLNPIYKLTHSAGWDFDLNNYRKVIDVYSFQEGNNSGVNTLFTIEHTIAQQAYFGHLLGSVGYDLITWHSLKNWLDLREKTLALVPYLRFSPENQILKIIPEPSQNSVYYGLVGCKVQKPIKDIVCQLWVYKYVMALTKITVANVRGKYSGTNLFGGQTVNYSDLMTQGIAERDKLEKEIESDLIDRDPIKFFIG